MKNSAFHLAIFSSLVIPCQAALIVNGDFEDTTSPFPAGWTYDIGDGNGGSSATVQQVAGLTAGSTTAAFIGPETGTASTSEIRIQQFFMDTGSDWTINFLLNSADPGGAGDRSFNGLFYFGNVNASQLNVRVVDLGNDGDGDFQIFNGTAWNTVFSDAFTFGNTADITISGNSGASGPVYDFTVDGSTQSGLTTFNDRGYSAGDGLEIVDFRNSSGSAAGYTIDNVSVIPEPSVGLLALLGMALAGRRRRD